MKRFVIVGTQRTGSTALARLLADHPQTACGLEWNQRVPWSQRITACERGLRGMHKGLLEMHRQHIEKQLTEQCRWVGYRNLIGCNATWLLSPALAPSLVRDRFRDCLSWWSRDNLAIIHIVRRDNLAWLRSKAKARQERSYWSGKTYSDQKVHIPIGQALKTVRMKEWLDNQLARLQHTNPYLLIEQSELFDIEGCAAKVQNFLNIDRRPAPAMPAMQSAGIAASQHILNYEALQSALGSSIGFAS